VAPVPRPESSDSEFTWENFQASVNKDLADVLGNFVSRITKFCRSKVRGSRPRGRRMGRPRGPAPLGHLGAPSRLRIRHGRHRGPQVAEALRALWVLGNEYLQSAAPWSTHKTDPDTAAMQTRLGLNLVRLYAVLSRPFIPDAANR
jgi:methionyl-tRNA synthetase